VSGRVRPSGHSQVVDRGTGHRWHALWRDGDGRHQRSLGPAWVKDSGKRTARVAIVWHTARPQTRRVVCDAADALRLILAGANRVPATRGKRRGPLFEAVAWEWMEHGERHRGLKRSTLREYEYLVRKGAASAGYGRAPASASASSGGAARHGQSARR
jgi:hypothetical protein